MQVFIQIISCSLVTYTPLEDLMRYPLAGKLYYSDLPLAMCGLISEKCNSEEVEVIQDTTVAENIYKNAFDMVTYNRGVINMPLFSLCPLLPMHWGLLPSLRWYSPINMFKAFFWGAWGVPVSGVFVDTIHYFFSKWKDNKHRNLF